MSRTFVQDYNWTMKLINSDVIPIFAEFLEVPLVEIKIATDKEDKEENTDLKVLLLNDLRIGVRLRQHEYFERYPDDITIRYERTHNKTEHDKIMEGWGNYFFYGFANENKSNLVSWGIYDLDVYREYVNFRLKKSKNLDFKIKHNKDYSSDFLIVKPETIKQQGFRGFKVYGII